MRYNRGQFLQAAAVLLIIGAEFAVAFYAGPPWAWILGLSLLLALCLFLGNWIMGDAMGIFITQRNLMSLSRLQLVAWSLVIFSGYLVALIQRIVHNVPDPLGLTVDPYLWGVLGISTASFVGTPMILSTKKDDVPSASALVAASTALNEPPAQIQQNAQGKLYVNASPSDARFSDLFQGDEIGDTAYVDVSKVQMFVLTAILIGSWCIDLWARLGNPGHDFAHFTLPPFSPGQLQLLAASHAGYLTFKAIDHTAGANP